MSVINVKQPGSFRDWLSRLVLVQKLNNPIGYVFMLLVALGLAYVVALVPLKISMLLIGALVGIPILILCFSNLHFGLIVMVSIAFLLGLAAKHTNAPIGTSMDGMLLVLMFGLLVRLVKERDFSFAKSPITIFIIAWIYYNFLQVINPWAESRMAWVYTVRSVALLLALYFIACYAFKNLKRILTVLKVILFFGFLAALYSLKQEFIGFTASEMAWLHADEERFMLIFQWGRLRVFSFFADPTTFGILMSYLGILCFILATHPFKIWKRLVLAIAGLSMMAGMAYAGSRTPFVLVPLGIIFYVVLTFKRTTLLVTGVIFILGTGVMMKSTSNAVVWRIQSAFATKADASVTVRLENQKKIQPFIQTHPVGAGLGSTGAWGKRFTPNSWLASFAHDSLYVRIAVEAGWIGLIIYMGLLFAALKAGIYYYFRCADPLIKILYLGITTCVFILAVACYPQEAITLPPTSIVFYIMLAMLVRLKDFDPNFRKEEVVN